MKKHLSSIQKLLQNERSRYLVIGGSVYVVELAVIAGAQLSGLSAVVAVACGFWTGLVLSFGLQKFVTFGDKSTHHKILLPQMAAFATLVLFNFGFTILMTALLSDIIPAVIIRTVALGITTIWNFYFYKTKIFTPPEVVA